MEIEHNKYSGLGAAHTLKQFGSECHDTNIYFSLVIHPNPEFWNVPRCNKDASVAMIGHSSRTA